jgi:Ribbon-helix-helix protein, copG family
MGKYKENPKYNVVSIRVTDEEKALLVEMTRRDRTNISDLMREAISIYTSFLDVSANRG